MQKYLLFILFCFITGSYSYGQSQDSTERMRNPIITDGNFSVGYEYGLLPFSIYPVPPEKNIKTDGEFGLKLSKLPLRISYYYSTMEVVSGINNHFTVHFDAQKYKQEQEQKLLDEKRKRSKKVDSLSLEKQNLETKLDYLNLLNDKKIASPSVDSSKFNVNIPSDSLANDFSMPHHDMDSLGVESSSFDTESLTADSLKFPPSNTEMNNSKSDSIQEKITALQNDIQTIETTIDQLNQMQGVISSDSLTNTDYSTGFPKPSFQESLFSSIKTLEIGMTHPHYSDFLISRTPVRGINAEFQHKKTYVAFTYGTPINNIFSTSIEDVNSAQQLFNLVNVRNVDSGRKIAAMKVGYGSKEGSHAFVGFLYGYGKDNYQQSLTSETNEKNLVGELDFRFKLSSKHVFDAVYGRSATQANSVNYGDEETVMSKLLDTRNRTNAALGRYQLKLKKTKAKVTIRVVDPFYQSYGVQYIRTDNFRYDIKITQKFGKKVSIGTFLRKEHDNLLGIHQNQNVILSYGVNATYRPNRHWTLKSDYRPILQQSTAVLTDTTIANNNNYIINSVVIYTNRINDFTIMATGVYSYYYLTNNETENIFTNLNLNLSIQHKGNIRNDIIFNQFNTNDISVVSSSSIIENDLSFMLKRITITGIGKASFSRAKKADIGYGLKTGIRIKKRFTLEFEAEKLVIGDFYSNMLQQNTINFPYYYSSSLRFNF